MRFRIILLLATALFILVCGTACCENAATDSII